LGEYSKQKAPGRANKEENKWRNQKYKYYT
jgi:hypothetical protein